MKRMDVVDGLHFVQTSLKRILWKVVLQVLFLAFFVWMSVLAYSGWRNISLSRVMMPVVASTHDPRGVEITRSGRGSDSCE